MSITAILIIKVLGSLIAVSIAGIIITLIWLP